jgi:hypothetical protein
VTTIAGHCKRLIASSMSAGSKRVDAWMLICWSSMRCGHCACLHVGQGAASCPTARSNHRLCRHALM